MSAGRSVPSTDGYGSMVERWYWLNRRLLKDTYSVQDYGAVNDELMGRFLPPRAQYALLNESRLYIKLSASPVSLCVIHLSAILLSVHLSSDDPERSWSSSLPDLGSGVIPGTT